MRFARKISLLVSRFATTGKMGVLLAAFSRYLQLPLLLQQAIIPVLVVALPRRYGHQDGSRQPRRVLVIEEREAVDALPVLRVNGVPGFEGRSRTSAEREIEVDEVVARRDVHLRAQRTSSASVRREERKEGERTYRSSSSLLRSFIPLGTTFVARPQSPVLPSGVSHTLGKIPSKSLLMNLTSTSSGTR